VISNHPIQNHSIVDLNDHHQIKDLQSSKRAALKSMSMGLIYWHACQLMDFTTAIIFFAAKKISFL
jgi:hypothetical protein